jgi:hypothetical protein
MPRPNPIAWLSDPHQKQTQVIYLLDYTLSSVPPVAQKILMPTNCDASRLMQ